jgi:hypothetical protein
MDRRDFLGGMSAIFAAGLVTDEAEAAGPPPAAPDEVEPWLAKLDQDLQRMSQQAPTEGVSEALHEAGLPPRLLGETFGTLSLFAAWRDSDEEVRQHPAFQARMFRAADALARRTVVIADWMEGLDRARRRSIGALLSRPNRLMAILDHVLIRKGERMNPARRRALRGTLGDIARATRKAGAKPEAFLDELILFVDYAAREEGVDRHALAAQERAAQARGEQTNATMETAEETSRLDKWFSSPDETIRLGLRLMGLAVLVSLGGVVLFFLSLAVFQALVGVAVLLTGLMCFVIGPLMLLTGLVLLIVGRVRRRRDAKEALEAEDEALLHLLGPEEPWSPQPA